MNSKLRIAFAVSLFFLLGATLLAVRSTLNADRLSREAAVARAAAAALRQQLMEKPSADRRPSSHGMDPEVWRERVRGLEAQLAEKDRLIASLQNPAAEAPPLPPGATNRPPENERRPRRDRGAWIEDLKQTDPERYEQIQARRRESRQRMQRSIAEQATYYLDRDTAAMDENERTEYDRMLGLLDETWTLAEQMQAELPGEEHRELMRTMHDNMRELTPMMESERDRAFYEVGLDFGYSDGEAQELTDYLNSVIEVTSMRTLFESMHGGGRGGGPPDGGEPGGP